MTAVRSALFFLCFQLWTLTLALAYLPLLLLPRAAMVPCARFWLHGVMALLKGVAGLSFEVRGRENMPQGAAIIAAKHQSAFETFIFHLILGDPAYVLKRELTWIPFFGWYLGKVGVIAIDRSAGTKALKAMVKGGEDARAENRPIVIFPEGTRVAPGAKGEYHSGIAMLYGALGLPVVPVALNSGLFWRRRGFAKRAGTITLEFLPPIPPGANRKLFMAQLETAIETATDRLVAEGRARYPQTAPDPSRAP